MIATPRLEPTPESPSTITSMDAQSANICRKRGHFTRASPLATRMPPPPPSRWGHTPFKSRSTQATLRIMLSRHARTTSVALASFVMPEMQPRPLLRKPVVLPSPPRNGIVLMLLEKEDGDKPGGRVQSPLYPSDTSAKQASQALFDCRSSRDRAHSTTLPPFASVPPSRTRSCSAQQQKIPRETLVLLDRGSINGLYPSSSSLLISTGRGRHVHTAAAAWIATAIRLTPSAHPPPTAAAALSLTPRNSWHDTDRSSGHRSQ